MSLINNAFLVGFTAILVTYLPTYFRTELPVVTDGFVASGFEEVQQAFRQNFQTGLDPRHSGSAFSAYYRGQKIVDIWGGYADAESKQVWKQDTLTIVFSTTKGMASLCIAMLADRGLLDYDKPVAHYWPEFAQKDKEKITVRQMMEHEAGLIVSAPPGFSLEIFGDVARAGALMAAAEPLWEPGTAHGYHAVTFGPLTNELLRRIDPEHRTMGQFFAQEVAEPFGVDFHIGLPLKESYRAARLAADTRSNLMSLMDGISSPLNRQVIWHVMRSNFLDKAVNVMGDARNFAVFNDPANRLLEIPSLSGFGTAEALAKVYSILSMGGTDPATNKTLLSKKLVDMFSNVSAPQSFDLVLGIENKCNLGMFISPLLDGGKVFGHPGAGGMVANADPRKQLSFAFVTRQMSAFGINNDPRYYALEKALYRCIEKLEKE